jgi:hypothetical protein
VANISPSTAVERRFYSIVRWFGLLITTTALVVAILAAVSGLTKLFPHANTNVRTPSATYDDLRRMTEAQRSTEDKSPAKSDNTLQQKEAAATAAAAEADFERRLKPHLDAIVGNLTSYAGKLDQAKPSAPAVGDYVRSNMQQIGRVVGYETLTWGFVEGLDRATHDLAGDAEYLSKLDSDDPRRIRWDRFLDWYSQQYRQQIDAELRRINAEQTKAVAEAADAPGYLYAGAVAFGIFILATLLLLLLRIELNTRPFT